MKHYTRSLLRKCAEWRASEVSRPYRCRVAGSESRRSQSRSARHRVIVVSDPPVTHRSARRMGLAGFYSAWRRVQNDRRVVPGRRRHGELGRYELAEASLWQLDQRSCSSSLCAAGTASQLHRKRHAWFNPGNGDFRQSPCAITCWNQAL
jgi:hypothetical protein